MQVDHRTANVALVQLSHKVDLELIGKKTDRGPLFAFLVLARRDAIQALQGLVHVDPAKPEDVRKLQNEVQRFIDVVAFVHEMLRQGTEAALELKDEEADEVRRLASEEGTAE